MSYDYKVASNDAFLKMIDMIPADKLKSVLMKQIETCGISSVQRDYITTVCDKIVKEMTT